MQKLCDLHTHSVFSDGTDTPAALINAAIDSGLSALALTDHNTVTGLQDFIAAAEGKPLDIAPGMEFTTADGEQELHILGLFIRPEVFSQVNEYINKATILKEESNYRLVQRLRKRGYLISYVEILEHSRGHVNRANIAAELVKKGYLESIDQGFKTILSKGFGLYEPPKRLSAIETIGFIRSVGAAAVWAHPYFHVSFDWSTEFLSRAKDAGLQGMETLYSTYDDATTAKAKEICAAFGLLESGGSDYHGKNKPHIALGKGMGNLEIPYTFYENLRALV